MAYCANCGHQNIDGSKFCHYCGAQVTMNTIKSSNQRQSVYEGEIRKCPSCGGVLDSFMAHCPSCGFEIRGAKVSDSAQEFALMLGECTTEKQKITLVRAFPIPNTKEDIIEFLILASSNICTSSHSAGSDTPQKEEYDAWLVKIEQCYQKAKMILKSDSDFPKVQEIYNQIYVKLSLEKSRVLKKNAINIIVKNAGVWFGLIALLIAIVVDMLGDRSGGVSELIQLIGLIVLIISTCILGRKNAGYIDFGIGALSGILTIILSFLLDNGSMLQLSGGVILIIVAVLFFRRLRKNND